MDSPPSTQRFGYDAGRIRKSKRAADGTKTKFHYGGLAVADESRTSTPASNAFFSGHQLLGFDRSGNFFYLLADGLASVRLVVNSSGVEAARYNSSESGNPIEATESGTSSSQTWVGALGVRDETAESGLHYMRHRFYDSGLGRFLTVDPIGYDGGLNLYGYVDNNPTNLVDPSGLKDTTWDFQNARNQEAQRRAQAAAQAAEREAAYERWMFGVMDTSGAAIPAAHSPLRASETRCWLLPLTAWPRRCSDGLSVEEGDLWSMEWGEVVSRANSMEPKSLQTLSLG